MAGFFSKILNAFSKVEVDWDELEELLIASDIGVSLSMEILDELQDQKRKLKGQDVVEVAKRKILEILPADQPVPAPEREGRPRTILIVGVNGTGKTTSTAKLAHLLKSQGHSVTLAAADTFRAAAIEQLETWAERLDLPIVKGQYKADPSSVCYDGWSVAKKNGSDFLLCDTAGRLHTRHNLMEELGKVKRTLQKHDASAPHQTYLVVDATTGSNALQQAKEFRKAVDLDGVIVTKLDGSGKGGILVAIQKELGIAPRFVGTGERAEDFHRFERERYVSGIL
ncbi:MAG: signal recognition particle-docking protein FtsY [Verrucomicrobiota bacterium]